MDRGTTQATLIELAYAWAEDATTLPALLTALADALHARGGLLLEHDRARRALVHGSVRCRPHVIAEYERRYAALDLLPRAARFAQIAKPGCVFVDEMVVPYADARSSTYHREFARPHGCARVLALGLQLDGHGFTGLVFTRSHGDGAFGASMVAFLSALSGHLLRAWRLGTGLRLASAIGAGALDVLDRRAHGVLLVDRYARIVHRNRAADAILAHRDGLQVSAGALTASDPTQATRLRSLVANAAESNRHAGPSAAGMLAVTRPSGRRAWPLTIGPLPVLPAAQRGDCATALVQVSDPDDVRGPAPRALRALFQMTDAEARVACLMARGNSSTAIATELGYSPASAAWYAKRVLAKAGAPTRAAFAAMVSSLEVETP